MSYKSVKANLLSNVEDLCPFNSVDFPRGMECTDIEPSEVELNNDEAEDPSEMEEGMCWDEADFEGEFVKSSFTCEDYRGGCKIELDYVEIYRIPSSPRDIDRVLEELQFVKDVLNESDDRHW